MPGFNSVNRFVTAQAFEGCERYFTWRKSPSQVTTQGIWFDLSMSPGNPVPQYYAASPLAAVVLSQSSDGGVFHGGSVSPAKKFVRKITAMTGTATALPMPMILCDYLLYYPFIDEGTNDTQTLNNSNTLTRWTDGVGVQAMAVVVGAHTGGAGVTFSINYTNSDGTAGRTSRTCTLTTAQTVNGTIATVERANAASAGPFIPLQYGDEGIRSIQSVTFPGTTDIGLITLVLVKPLAQMSIRGIDAPVELDSFLHCGGGFPRVYDDAYLNFLCCPSGSLAATAIHGDITYTWG